VYRSEEIRRAARVIEPELSSLLGAEAPPVQQRLSQLLAEADAGKAVDTEVITLLASREVTRERLETLLGTTEGLDAEKDYSALPGWVNTVPARWYACPEGDYEWPRFDVSEDVPECPVHHVALVRKNL
jgi:hypothetical protein